MPTKAPRGPSHPGFPLEPHGGHPAALWGAETQEITLPWEERFAVRQRRPGGVRLPGPDDPAPATGQIVAVCGWAAVLGLVGLVVAARALVILLAGTGPGWYEPTVITVGLVGMALTAMAFMTMQHERLPLGLLAAATVTLAANVAATVAAG